MTYETFIQSQSPKKYRLLKDVNIPKIRCEQAPCPQSIWKKGDIVMGIFHPAQKGSSGGVIGCVYLPDIPAQVEIWKDLRSMHHRVNATDVEERSLISSETTAAVKSFFEKPANVAIASVFATLLVISAFNWKKIAQLMK